MEVRHPLGSEVGGDSDHLEYHALLGQYAQDSERSVAVDVAAGSLICAGIGVAGHGKGCNSLSYAGIPYLLVAACVQACPAAAVAAAIDGMGAGLDVEESGATLVVAAQLAHGGSGLESVQK